MIERMQRHVMDCCGTAVIYKTPSWKRFDVTMPPSSFGLNAYCDPFHDILEASRRVVNESLSHRDPISPHQQCDRHHHDHGYIILLIEMVKMLMNYCRLHRPTVVHTSPLWCVPSLDFNVFQSSSSKTKLSSRGESGTRRMACQQCIAGY